jgi:hypothetical protein
MVALDASVLLFLFDENTPASVPGAKERVEYLVQTLSDAGEKIIIPTPALSECLVHAGPAGPEYLAIITKQACFRVAAFDERAAVEVAVRTFQARQSGQKKGGNPDATKAKIKFDRQIVAIAAIEGASVSIPTTRMFSLMRARRECRLTDLPSCPCHQRTLNMLWRSSNRRTFRNSSNWLSELKGRTFEFKSGESRGGWRF